MLWKISRSLTHREVGQHHSCETGQSREPVASHQQGEHQTDQQIPLKLNGECPIHHVNPGHTRQIVQIGEMEQQALCSHGQPRQVKQRRHDEVGRQNGHGDGSQIGRIQTHVALQQKPGIIP